MILFEFRKDRITPMEWLMIGWISTLLMEEMREVSLSVGSIVTEAEFSDSITYVGIPIYSRSHIGVSHKDRIV